MQRKKRAEELTSMYVQGVLETNAFQQRTTGRVTRVLLLKAIALIKTGKPKSSSAALLPVPQSSGQQTATNAYLRNRSGVDIRVLAAKVTAPMQDGRMQCRSVAPSLVTEQTHTSHQLLPLQ